MAAPTRPPFPAAPMRPTGGCPAATPRGTPHRASTTTLRAHTRPNFAAHMTHRHPRRMAPNRRPTRTPTHTRPNAAANMTHRHPSRASTTTLRAITRPNFAAHMTHRHPRRMAPTHTRPNAAAHMTHRHPRCASTTTLAPHARSTIAAITTHRRPSQPTNPRADTMSPRIRARSTIAAITTHRRPSQPTTTPHRGTLRPAVQQIVLVRSHTDTSVPIKFQALACT
mmetsp:Transcript_68347/g.189953  ORF Transcript_68347/g.189953 Transcript_68347/m.189953 type:complete len:225 (-) Transcript_68347:109-783(-)